MAVAYETSYGSGALVFDGTPDTENLSVDAGTGSNRVLIAGIYWRDVDSRTQAMTYNGVSMTACGAKVESGTYALRLFYLANPASGTNTLAVSLGDSGGGGSVQVLVGAWCGNGCDITTTPVDGFNTNSGTGASANIVSSVTVSGDSGDRIVVFHATRNASEIISVTTSTGYTERQDVNNSAGSSLQIGSANGSASLNTQATWNNTAITVDWVAAGININQASAGTTMTPAQGPLTLTGTGLGLGFTINMPDEL
jgi:hypothetical protein